MSEASATPDPEEVIRRNVEALNRRDYDAILATFAEDALWETPDLDVRHGREAIRSLFEEWSGVYEEFEHALLDFCDHGSGVNFTEELQRGRLPGSNQFVENHYATVTVWNNGLVERVTTYQDISEARTAAVRLAGEREGAAGVDRGPDGVVMPDGSPEATLVELAQRSVDASNRGDIDGLMRLYSPSAVWDSGSADLAGERFEGSAALRSFFEEWFTTLEDVTMEAEEIRDVGNGVVLCHLVQRGRPHGSAATVEFRLATVSVWAAGLIDEVRVYTSVDEARAAAQARARERA
jgi:ketosteroid isomerase-like protein